MDETMNAMNETAISQDSETQQGATGTSEADTQSQVQGTSEDATAQALEEGQHTDDAGNASEEPFLEIKYLKEMRGLTRDEAKNYAEIGMRYQGVRDKLERYATLKGVTVDEFISGLEAAEDEAYRNSLIEKFGGDEDTVEQMMELYNIKKQQTLDNANKSKKEAAAAEEQNVNARIADEFTKMKSEFPELTEFSALPKEVREAAFNGKALAWAYLEHKHKEAQKIAGAAAAEENAAKKSTGSIANNVTDSKTDDERRYLSALWGK